MKSADISVLFGIDLRGLAALRIALGALLLFDLAQRGMDLAAFCTDDGVMTVSAAQDLAGTPVRWSLHALSGGFGWQAALFSLAAVFALLLALGYHTRLATVASWLLLISLHSRTPLATTGGDLLLRMLLFWGMLLPLGARWSLDAHTSPRRKQEPLLAPRACVSVASAGVLLQVALMYLFSGLHKWNGIWLDGEALSRVFHNPMWSRPLGRALLDYPVLLRGLTWGTLTFEVLGPVLLFVPWRTKTVRVVALVAFLLMHVFIELTMSVGMFSYVALTGLLLFVPPFVWERCRERPLRRSAAAIATPIRDPRNATEGVPYRRWLANAVSAFFLAYVVLWNVADPNLFGGRLTFLMPRSLWPIAHATSIDQHWTMFTEPPAIDGWFAAWARLRDGRVVDLLRGGKAVSDDRPSSPTGDYWNQRWQKLFANLLEPRLVKYRSGVAEYFARQWNDSHTPEVQVLVVDFYYFGQRTDQPDRLREIHRHALAHVELASPEETDAFSELQRRFR